MPHRMTLTVFAALVYESKFVCCCFYRSALCKDEGAGYAYYNANGQCYKVGTDGPCEALMIFSLDPTSPDYGQCDCDYHRQCGRPIIKWPADGECYYVFDQVSAKVIVMLITPKVVQRNNQTHR